MAVASATVVAPADGTIIDSRVEKKMGQVMAQGDPLLEFAPESGWKLLIFVPEAAAIYVDSQQEGGFASAAKPHVKVPFAIEQMDGSAEVIEEDNVFVARAVLQSSPSWMRSGMRGVARIDTVRKPVWWVVAHNVLDWTRLRFWI